ncbi:aconitase family protein [Shigella flexneri]
MLRKHGVVGKFVEFSGDGLDSLPLADRATIADMSPEYRCHLWLLPNRCCNPRLHALSGRSEIRWSVEKYQSAGHVA